MKHLIAEFDQLLVQIRQRHELQAFRRANVHTAAAQDAAGRLELVDGAHVTCWQAEVAADLDATRRPVNCGPAVPMSGPPPAVVAGMRARGGLWAASLVLTLASRRSWRALTSKLRSSCEIPRAARMVA